MTLHITGATNDIRKVSFTRYLVEELGLRLRDAKRITDDVLAGVSRHVPVPLEGAEQHRLALEALGARVELVVERNDSAAA